MKLTRFDDADGYYQRVKSYLLKHEAVHCLLLGISQSLCGNTNDNDSLPYLVLVESDRIIATAIRTPPRKLILSQTSSHQAIESIAKDLASESRSLPGVIAPKSEAQAFVNIWQDLTGKSYELNFAMSVHQLEKLQPITYVSGKLRLATQSDRNLLTGWGQAFEQEALGDKEPKSDINLWFDRHLKNDSLFVWQDDAIVSMAVYGGTTPNGIRINAVYTPPEYRGKGYATACVAKISQQLLERYKYCFLFTNLANPVSNHIYRKIGYLPIGEIGNYSFH